MSYANGLRAIRDHGSAECPRKWIYDLTSMRNLTRYLLWAYVFTVPWDTVVLPLVGSVSRLCGLVVLGAAVLTLAVEGRFRRPDAVVGFAIAFSVWNALSLLWTLDYANTLQVVNTYAQLAAMVWVIRELVRTREELQPLLAAFLFGLFLPLTDLLNNFRLNITGTGDFAPRFTGMGHNANQAGIFLVMGLPIAWHLVMRSRGIVRLAALAYVVTAPVGLLLTGTRGAMIAGLAASVIVPLTLFRQSLRSYALGGVVLMVGTLAAVQFVPTYNWERMGSTVSEVTGGGTMTGRTILWTAGLQAFQERPLQGAGAGAMGAAIDPYLPNNGPVAAHNATIGLLVQVGIVGLVLFAGIFGACAWTVIRSPLPSAALYGVLLLTWLVGSMSDNLENRKLTWLLFGLVAAQSGLAANTATGLVRQRHQYRSGNNATGAMPRAPSAAGVVPQAARIQ